MPVICEFYEYLLGASSGEIEVETVAENYYLTYKAGNSATHHVVYVTDTWE